MNEETANETATGGGAPGLCPFHHVRGPVSPVKGGGEFPTISPLPVSERSRVDRSEPALTQKLPAKGDGGAWRYKSRREGVNPVAYVFWYTCHFFSEFFNRKLARSPNILSSWYNWNSITAGLAFLLSKLWYVRDNSQQDPYAYKTNDTLKSRGGPPKARHEISADARGVADDSDQQMGSELTRMGSNMPFLKARPDLENITPSANDVAKKLKLRRIDPVTGKEITIYAGIMNIMGQIWIQYQFHGFGGNTLRCPIGDNPHRLPRDKSEGWPNNEAVVDRTMADPTRVTNDGRPTPINQIPMSWINAQTYGTNEDELNSLRAHKNGHMRLDGQGFLPEDEKKPGIDLTGFNNNFNPGLSLIHWLVVMEHNAVAEYYAKFHPDWHDEKLFRMAQRVIMRLFSRIHTIYWTEDLLQNPILTVAMHADWYGLIGKRAKNYLMRLAYRHPFVAWLIKPLRNSILFWGTPGGKWKHDGGPFQVAKHFRLMYRLHEMLLSEYDIQDVETNRLMARIKLEDFIHENTRPIVMAAGYANLAWSFVKQSCGALVPHNFPRALAKFRNQQNQELTNLAELDVFRERDGTGTWNQVRESLGEPKFTTFLEAAGGNADLAKELAETYPTVDDIDAHIGVLCEPKPPGSALGEVQFFQFELNAPNRIRNNRHLTEGDTYAELLEGMDWSEHSGGPFGVWGRHLPALKPRMEGVTRFFAPWPDADQFPKRQLDKTHQDTFDIFKADLKTVAFGAIACGIACWFHALNPWLAATLLGLQMVTGASVEVKRLLAMRFLQSCWQVCYTDKRNYFFGTLSRAERWINRAASWGKVQAALVSGFYNGLAASVYMHGHPWLALLFVIIAFLSLKSLKASQTYADDALVLKVALRNRMRVGSELTDPAKMPGETALQKRYWFLKGDNKHPVATYRSCLKALMDSGLPRATARATTILSLLSFGKKTQKGMTWRQKRENGIGLLFDRSIYLPNIAEAFGETSTRIYARPGNAKGLKPGDIDIDAFNEMFDRFAPGREELTAYDFARMGEWLRWRDAKEGRGSFISRFVGSLAFKRRIAQLIPLFADTIVEEDRLLVPAVSRGMLLRFYQGAAQADLLREHLEGDRDPSPEAVPNSLSELAGMTAADLERVYRDSDAGTIPDGDSRGRAIFKKPGLISAKLLSLFANLCWYGKVFDAEDGRLINKILGRRLINADVGLGESWYDGKQSIIIDYKKTSWLAFFVRDEIRELQEGLYLGKAYVRLPFGHRFDLLFFALDFRK